MGALIIVVVMIVMLVMVVVVVIGEACSSSTLLSLTGKNYPANPTNHGEARILR